MTAFKHTEMVAQSVIAAQTGPAPLVVAEAEAPLVLVQDIVKSYDDVVVLDHVSLHVDRGETLVVVGGSGAGKSTLIRQVLGLEKPDSGRVIIDLYARRSRPAESAPQIRARVPERRFARLVIGVRQRRVPLARRARFARS